MFFIILSVVPEIHSKARKTKQARNFDFLRENEYIICLIFISWTVENKGKILSE